MMVNRIVLQLTVLIKWLVSNCIHFLSFSLP
uniref:Uncharacterized protein n=1 Tax=Anguilla anguilla TaxID=7936 RepID=A0A0E9R7F6_ANGAN